MQVDLAGRRAVVTGSARGIGFADALPTSLLRRFVTPREIADLVVFLASGQASAITGAALRVDGGILRNML